MGYRKWKRGFRVPVRRRSRLRRLGDLILFCTLAFGSIYAIARYLPDREVEGAARVMARVTEMQGGRDYNPEFGTRLRGQGSYADMIAQRFGVATARLGLIHDLPPLRCDLFTVPRPMDRQLSLF